MTRKLEVNGTIAGQQLNEFLPNPTLKEVREVTAACSFKELVVMGKVVIEDSLNDQNLETLLSDVVYESQETDTEVVIAAPKTFFDLEVKGNIGISSNFVNDQDLNNFALTDREQTMSISKIGGDVFFSNLKLFGLFDGINATNLEQSSIRTFGDQFIETPIIVSDRFRAEGASVGVKESLNGILTKDFLFVDQPITFAPSIKLFFRNITVENVKLQGDIVGAGTYSNFNVSDLLTNHMSKSLDQNILVPVKVKSLTTNGTFHSKGINGIKFDEFIKYMRGIRDFKSLILSGEQRVDNLIVNGDVNLKSINERIFDQIVENVIWLNKPNNVELKLKFLDELVVQGDLTVQGEINKKAFNRFVENWISREENPILVHSDKIFANDAEVGSVKTTEINGIKKEDLLMVNDVIEVQDLSIIGNVHATNLKVESIFNQKLAKSLEEMYSYDPETYLHCLTSSVHFNQPTTVDYLNTPVLNKVEVNKWLENLIKSKDENVKILSEKIFSKEILARQGFSVEFFNEINMKFLDHIIMTTDDHSVIDIESDLVFKSDVYAQLIAIKGDLFTRFISSCDTIDWLNNALPTDRDIVVSGESIEEKLD